MTNCRYCDTYYSCVGNHENKCGREHLARENQRLKQQLLDERHSHEIALLTQRLEEPPQNITITNNINCNNTTIIFEQISTEGIEAFVQDMNNFKNWVIENRLDIEYIELVKAMLLQLPEKEQTDFTSCLALLHKSNEELFQRFEKRIADTFIGQKNNFMKEVCDAADRKRDGQRFLLN